MRRSSTSSSSPRQWRRFAALLLLLLGTAEALLYVPHVRELLPPRTHYYHPSIARRLDLLERVTLLHGGVDVLFIGSSIVRTNLHPVEFDLIARQYAGNLVSFNLGLPGLWPTAVDLYARNLWLPATRPRVVVQGVRFAEIAAQTHAKNETQVWSGRIEPSWREGDMLTQLRAGAVSRLYLLQYHGAITRLLQGFREGWVGASDPDSDEAADLRGYLPRTRTRGSSPATWQADLPNDGTCDGSRCAVGFAALRRTIAAARAAGGTYVLVNVPEHPIRWQSEEAVQRYRDYLRRMQRFAESEGVHFVDPTDGDPLRFDDRWYSDLTHLTAAGARHFTREVATRLSPVLEAVLPRSRALQVRARAAVIHTRR